VEIVIILLAIGAGARPAIRPNADTGKVAEWAANSARNLHRVAAVDAGSKHLAGWAEQDPTVRGVPDFVPAARRVRRRKPARSGCSSSQSLPSGAAGLVALAVEANLDVVRGVALSLRAKREPVQINCGVRCVGSGTAGRPCAGSTERQKPP
jgi:hypothetical protein